MEDDPTMLIGLLNKEDINNNEKLSIQEEQALNISQNNIFAKFKENPQQARLFLYQQIQITKQPSLQSLLSKQPPFRYGPSYRNVSCCFSSEALAEFLLRNGIDVVIRAHQLVGNGYQFPFAQTADLVRRQLHNENLLKASRKNIKEQKLMQRRIERQEKRKIMKKKINIELDKDKFIQGSQMSPSSTPSLDQDSEVLKKINNDNQDSSMSDTSIQGMVYDSNEDSGSSTQEVRDEDEPYTEEVESEDEIIIDEDESKLDDFGSQVPLSQPIDISNNILSEQLALRQAITLRLRQREQKIRERAQQRREAKNRAKIMRKRSNGRLLVTVFSAPNYANEYDNAASQRSSTSSLTQQGSKQSTSGQLTLPPISSIHQQGFKKQNINKIQTQTKSSSPSIQSIDTKDKEAAKDDLFIHQQKQPPNPIKLSRTQSLIISPQTPSPLPSPNTFQSPPLSASLTPPISSGITPSQSPQFPGITQL
ncbi:MAG: hypothetical protein EZS28_026953, partial [Streblomastix strix]